MTQNDTASAPLDAGSKLPFEAEHLEALERMRMLTPYYQWVYEKIAPHLGDRIMDAGCGIGNFTQFLEQTAKYVLAVDLSPKNTAFLNERFRDSMNVEVLNADLEHNLDEIREKRIDTVVCLDVLEHVEDDVALLESFRKVIVPGGTLLIKVPACKWLYGSVDIASSHFRRYNKAELASKAKQAGWQTTSVCYMNIFGVAPYWLKSCVLKRQTNFSRTFPRWQISLLRRAIPAIKIIDGIIGPPIGQSAILVAK